MAHAVTNPTNLGPLPVQIWSNHILPLLKCAELKKFQRVSQVSKLLTLSPSLAKKTFRSDVNPKDLKSIKVGTDLAASRDYEAVNPFLCRITGYCAEPYEDFYVFMSSLFMQGQSSKTHGVEQYSARHENATNPPVSELKLDINPPSTVFAGSFKKEMVKVVGSGRPLFGGKEKVVTCRDVMIAFTKYTSRFNDCESFQMRLFDCRTIARLLECFSILFSFSDIF